LIAALILGSTTALMWAVSALLAAPSSRLAGPAQALFWTSVVGSGTAALFAIPSGPPEASTADWGLMVLVGFGYLGGIGLFLLAVNAGRVSLITPIVACDGAIGTAMAAATGASITTTVGVALAVMVAGILLVTRAGPEGEGEGEGGMSFGVARMRPVAVTAAIAAASATAFGLVFVASGRIDDMSALWMTAIARAFPLVGGLILCLLSGRLLPERGAWKWLVAFGLIDTGGYLVYVWAAREDTAIAPVAASQYAALAAIGAVLVLHERLSRFQLGGVVALLAGIALIASQGVA
jgi:drug/metabolite transporter (DMT)-like permease